MLLPESNTASSFLNKTADALCPIEFVRWCWLACLHIDEQTTKIRDLRNDVISYAADVQKSKWMTDNEFKPFQRLFTPQIDLPSKITIDKDAPQIIIHTSTADVLRDDGLDLIACLQQHHKNESETNDVPGNLYCFEGNGSHALSLDLDKKTTSKLIHTWYQAIYEA